LYAGTLGIAQGLLQLLEAAALAGPDVVELSIAGDGPDAATLRSEVETRGLLNVRLLGPIPSRRIPSLYQDVDAGIVPLRDRPIFSGALPTKLFEILAAGRPAIVAARGEAAELVREAGAGLAVAPEDPYALSETFRALQSSPGDAVEMGRRGRQRARAFGRACAIQRWYELLGGLEIAASDRVRVHRRRSRRSGV
jgi:glycosyltransferase involved in cell wall biosynthesis